MAKPKLIQHIGDTVPHVTAPDKERWDETTIINDSLISTSITEALSANQGRVLNENLIKASSSIDNALANLLVISGNKSVITKTGNECITTITDKNDIILAKVIVTKNTDGSITNLSQIYDKGVVTSEITKVMTRDINGNITEVVI